MELTEENFKSEVLQSDVPVLVDFWAPWCLGPKSKLIFNPEVRDIKEVREGSKLLSFDKNFKEIKSNIVSTHRVILNQMIKIKTDGNRELVCTPEHLILTKNGFKKAEDLQVGDLLSTYLFADFYLNPNGDKKMFLTEEKVRETAENLSLNKPLYINELREKNLLTLKYNQEKTYILANLIGFLLTDGSLSMTKNNERFVEFFVGKKQDAESVIQDLRYLGFSPSFRRRKSRKGEINGRKFTQSGYRVRVTKTALFILLVTLGGIVGKKFFEGLKIPEWILKGPKEVQRAFLQGFLGGDGSRVVIRTRERKKRVSYNTAEINPIEFHFSSFAENSPNLFAKQLSQLLSNFGVKVKKTEIKIEDRYKRKDGKESKLLKIWIGSDFKSAYAYASIGFKYAYTKKIISALAKAYLEQRLTKINERRRKRSQVLRMGNNFSISEISKKLDLNYCIVNNWLQGRKAFPPRDAMPYKDWLKIYTDDTKKVAFEKVKIIKKYNKRNYKFISLILNNDTKMFVADGVIHHNCAPCKMIAPAVEEIGEEYKGKVKVGKLNIDNARSIATQYQVMSIPTVAIFKDGEVVDKVVGVVDKTKLEEKIKPYIE